MLDSHFIPTIIIVDDAQAHLRGYSLLGREFVLKEPVTRDDVAYTLDGSMLQEKYWVVSKKEYMRIVPEARSTDFDSEEIYIPWFVAQFSFVPCYYK